MAQGEYIVPERIEVVYVKALLVAPAWCLLMVTTWSHTEVLLFLMKTS